MPCATSSKGCRASLTTHGAYSPALITFAGDLTFGINNNLEIEIGGLLRGTEYDALDVGGTATLDGTLTVLLINGFNPAAGDTFDIIIATTTVGQFATELTPPLDPGLFWITEYDLDPSGNDTVSLFIDTDDDTDGLSNTQDNCTQVSNPDQTDSDGDLYGNACDADFNNDGVVNGLDVGPFIGMFGTAPGPS